MASFAEVTGCADCPIAAYEVLDWGARSSETVCLHPVAKTDDGAPATADVDRPIPKMPPEWCPLRTSPLTVQLRAAPPKAATPNTREGE